METENKTVWIVELEEDPETGDMMMQLPMELLEAQGWKVGDTLSWDLDEMNGTATLSKKDEDIEKP